MDIEVTRAAMEQIARHARTVHPREACGILLGEGVRIEAAQACANVHALPHERFEIDPQALIDAHRAARSGGPQVLGYYHSHPGGASRPSVTDRQMAAGDGRIWAICSKDGVAFWRDDPAGFTALSFRLVGR